MTTARLSQGISPELLARINGAYNNIYTDPVFWPDV